MKIAVPNLNKEGFGGGWTFMENFRTAAEKLGHVFTDDISNSDVVFVSNPMWAERADFEKAKACGKRVVLRLDNIPEDWNNRGTAISKIKDFIQAANWLVFQSIWAAEKYKEFCAGNGIETKPNGQVIYNGVNSDVFNMEGRKVDFGGSPTLLYVKSSRNENKRYPEVLEMYRRYWYYRKSKGLSEPILLLAGQFSREIQEYNFGFYNGEKYKYLGATSDYKALAEIYRSSDVLLHPAFADAAPNTVLEAMACGCIPIIHQYGGGIEFFGKTENEHGVVTLGAGYASGFIENALKINKEIMAKHVKNNFNVTKMANEYLEALNGQLV